MRTQWKLVILYDARTNTYAVCSHNLTAEEAEAEVARWREQTLPAMTVNQRVRHRTADPETCRACRRDVERSAGLQPKPQFQRRNRV